jgi:1-deoxy-D-xylulose-5-phosphate synthase
MDPILSGINSPADLRKLSLEEMERLAFEIRQRVIEVTSVTGGHVATNLGIVELTLALHYVFDTPRDKIVFDVSNQTYPHKLITGRKDKFHTVRTYQGLCGFSRIDESEYDTFGAGHASTGISAALGMVAARDLAKEDYKVVCVVGDGALTGGLAFEGLNNAGSLKKDFLVILNDNSMSISKNVGAISTYLTQVLTDTTYNKIKKDLWKLSGKLKEMVKLRKHFINFEESVKGFLVPGILFEKLGFRYFGPIDGHDLDLLIKTLQRTKTLKGPLLLHVATLKGKGYKPAEQDATTFHGMSAFDVDTGKSKPSSGISYSSLFGQTLSQIAEEDPKVVAITAAMCSGTGLNKFEQQFPERFYDVGIAESHAVTFAAGLAATGARPFLAIYSTFLQRGFDQVVHDVALQNLPVRLCIDRAGLVGEDGPTHHGVFDLTYLRMVPEMTILAPSSGTELVQMLNFAAGWDKGPLAIRYPRGTIPEAEIKYPVPEMKDLGWEILKEGENLLILACGSMVAPAARLAEALWNYFNVTSTVVNCRVIKPLDEKMLLALLPKFSKVVTMEENVLSGGFGSAILEYMESKQLEGISVCRLGIPDSFVTHGDRKSLLKEVGLDDESIMKKVTDFLSLTQEKRKIVFKTAVATQDSVRVQARK